MKGKVIKYEQDNIDTDVILPGPYLKLHEHAELAEHAMEGMDPDFHSKVKKLKFELRFFQQQYLFSKKQLRMV